MKTSHKVLIALLVVIPITIFGAWHYVIKNQYDHVRLSSNTLLLELEISEANEAQLIEIETIREDWHVAFTDSKSMTEALKALGFEQSLNGLQEFWLYEVPQYSFLKPESNQLAISERSNERYCLS